MTEDKIKQFPLFHGMRSKKSAEQIKKEGFCAYGSSIDEKKNIINALKYFGKEKFLTTQHRKGERVRSMLKEIDNKHRLNTYATTQEDAPCKWWAKSNPEHVSLTLNMIYIPPDKINKYLNEKFGSNCYNVKLKMTSRGKESNFNTGLKCIPPNLISKVTECKKCEYSEKEETE